MEEMEARAHVLLIAVERVRDLEGTPPSSIGGDEGQEYPIPGLRVSSEDLGVIQ
jgi:hypothetical protein